MQVRAQIPPVTVAWISDGAEPLLTYSEVPELSPGAW